MKVENIRFKDMKKGREFKYGNFNLIKIGNRRAINKQDPDQEFYFREKDVIRIPIEN